MNLPIIDAHIHLDRYPKKEQQNLLNDLEKDNIKGLLAVSTNLTSSKNNRMLAENYKQVYPAFGYHPEQEMPTGAEIDKLFQFLNRYKNEMTAIGETGLPYYRRQTNPDIPLEPYIELLERFILKAKQWHKPVVLHAIYEDAPIALDLLEKHSVTQAHFHWFKGSPSIIERMIANRYVVSITPDLFYKERTRQLVAMYPLSLLMVETDGPWPFEGPFKHEQTHPRMIHSTIQKIAEIKKVDIQTTYNIIYQNTLEFYNLSELK